VDIGYTHKPEQLKWIDGAPEAIRLLNDLGYYVIVITNQSGIARGYFDEAAVQRFHAQMQDSLHARGAHIDAFYYCPHHPDGTVKKFAVQCRCRKPGSGLLEQAAQEWPIDQRASFLIGDRDADLAAAEEFHIRGIKFDSKTMSLLDVVHAEVALSQSKSGRK
jgi:D-glycero-D-manno-heptose 1,7-bisphosphate phosphatase